MKDWVRVGLRLPPEINEALGKEAHNDYTTKNQKAIEIFLNWMKENEAKKQEARA
jgi:hypothetical protein